MSRGSGTPDALEAWATAKIALDAWVDARAQVFEDEAEARSAA
jgi:hypothetical protein